MQDYEIWCGDALSLPLPNDAVDLTVFSPPYEDARQYGDLHFKVRGQAWVEWMIPRLVEALRVTKGLVACVVNGKTKDFKWSGTPFRLWCALEDLGYAMRKPLLYERSGIFGSGGPDWFADGYELVVCAQKKAGRLPWSENTAMGQPCKYPPGGPSSYRTKSGMRVRKAKGEYKPPQIANPGNIIHCVVGGGHMGHDLAHENEAPFPERIPEWFIRSCCPPGGLVLDIMAGSGTTLAAAKKCGRRAIGVDIRRDQCELMQRRLWEEVQIKPDIVPIGGHREPEPTATTQVAEGSAA